MIGESGERESLLGLKTKLIDSRDPIKNLKTNNRMPERVAQNPKVENGAVLPISSESLYLKF